MRSVRLHYIHSYNLIFFPVIIPILLVPPAFAIDTHILPSSESLASNRTLVSLGNDFELGFFKKSSSFGDNDRWYIGIWYKKVPERTYVWVANRDNPLSDSAGTLKISGINLVLLDQYSNIPVWSTNLTKAVRSSMVAEILPNGNFVLRDSKSNGQDGVVWQSFDYPTDTLLPHMKLGVDLRTRHNRFLRSWKTSNDLSSGEYTFKLRIRGLPEFFIWKGAFPPFRSGPWDGKRFSGIPEMQLWHQFNIVYNFTENSEEVSFSFRDTYPNTYSRLIITYQGFLELFTVNIETPDLTSSWMSSTDSCVEYRICRDDSYCDKSMSQVCNCFKGFVPSNDSTLEPGMLWCERKTPLSCTDDGFIKMSNMKLPDTSQAIVDRRIGLKECEERCMRDCNCTGYANADIRNGGSGCLIWTGQFKDVRRFGISDDAGQDLYVKSAAIDLVEANNNSGKSRATIGLSVGATLLLLLGFIIFLLRRKHMQARALAIGYRRQNLLRTSGTHISEEDTEDLELPLIEYDVVSMATNDFSDSNKLGEGGFGTVYKGMLPDGEEIAVKRLSKGSNQGTDEFKTELMLIAKLQHNNLVRLLGCYADEEEKILVYEYLENLSLDYCLFEKTKRYELNWQKRFDIIKGIARGLLYLHQDSRCRVIHRDLKASNILLDKDMIPKISDFGMARMFARDEEAATTRRIIGTYGYMSPEYMTSGKYSEKSDVFSFGVLILEIVCGKKNSGFTSSDRDSSLLSYVWRHMEEGAVHAVVDPNIIDSSSPSASYRFDEVLRCIHIGLTCVQGYADDRPTMSWVYLMLTSEAEPIRKPRQPSYCVGRIICDKVIERTRLKIQPR